MLSKYADEKDHPKTPTCSHQSEATEIVRQKDHSKSVAHHSAVHSTLVSICLPFYWHKHRSKGERTKSFRCKHGPLTVSCTAAHRPSLPRVLLLHRQKIYSLPWRWTEELATLAAGLPSRRPPAASCRVATPPDAPGDGRNARPGHAPAARPRAHRGGLLGGRGAGGHEDPRRGLRGAIPRADGRAPFLWA